MSEEVKITERQLNTSEIISMVESDNSGSINVFIGTVRNYTKGKEVIRLEFEAYESMAIKEMQKIIDEVKKRWPINHIVIHHRVGALNIGDIPVVIAVSTPHRKDGFEACQFAIDTLKETVPIWKKEIFEDGEEWVSAHP
ncbi:MAG: molybdenum cofactor biosynthesis protein MoaE [Bacteroidota bacterium]